MPTAWETQQAQTLPGSPASLIPHLLPSVLSSCGAHFSDLPRPFPPPRFRIHCSLHWYVLFQPQSPPHAMRDGSFSSFVYQFHCHLLKGAFARPPMSILTLPEFSCMYLFFMNQYHSLIQSLLDIQVVSNVILTILGLNILVIKYLLMPQLFSQNKALIFELIYFSQQTHMQHFLCTSQYSKYQYQLMDIFLQLNTLHYILILLC